MSEWRCSHGAPAHVNCFDCIVEGVDMSPIVHYSSWSQQPDVWLACGRWTTPAWSQMSGLEQGVYQEGDGELYTFEHVSRVSCQGCLDSIASGKTEPR